MYGVLESCLFALVCIQIELQRNFKLYCLYFFFSKFELPNQGCGLSTGAAYTRNFTVYCIYLVSLSWETNNSFCSDPSRARGHADDPGILRAATESEISLCGVNKVGGHKKKKNLCFLQSKM